eukprot:Nk52_evm15s564 gene=Nk52_evmTU15s564
MNSFSIICVSIAALAVALCCLALPVEAFTCPPEYQNLSYGDNTWKPLNNTFFRCKVGCSNDGEHYCDPETDTCNPQQPIDHLLGNEPWNWGTCTKQHNATGADFCFDDVVYETDPKTNNITMTCRILSQRNPGEGKKLEHKDKNTVLLCPQTTPGKPWYARSGNFQGKRRNTCVCPSNCPVPCGQYHAYCAASPKN